MTDRIEWPAKKIACWLIVSMSLIVLWGAWLHNQLHGEIVNRKDLIQDWVSARCYFAGDPIYGDVRDAVRKHSSIAYEGPLRRNAHPPVSVLFSLPCGLLDFDSAYRVWTLTWLASLPISLWLLVRLVRPAVSSWSILPLSVLVVLSAPLAEEIKQGQFNLPLLLLLVAALSALRHGRPVLAGTLIGTAAAIKLFPAFLLWFFVVTRNWRALGAALISIALWHGIAWYLFGTEAFWTFIVDVLPLAKQNDELWQNLSLRGFWCKLFDAPRGFVVPLANAPMLARVGWLASSALIFVLTTRQIWKNQIDPDHAFGLCVVAMLLLTPVVWAHYLLLLVVPLALLWPSARRDPCLKWSLLVIGAILLVVRPVWIWQVSLPWFGPFAHLGGNQYAPRPVHTVTALSYQLYSLIALYGLAIAIAKKSSPNERTATLPT